MTRRMLSIVTILVSISANSFAYDRITGKSFASRSEVIAPHGMVATSHPLVTQIALDVLKDGGTAVDASGTLYDGTPLDGPAGLRSVLLKRKDVVLRTFTENLMAYGLGRRIEPYDMPTVRKVVRDAGAADHRFSSFVIGIVKSPAFRMSRVDASTH